MKRKQFLLTTLAAIPAMAFPQVIKKSKSTRKSFVIRKGGSRFGEPMMYRGLHPNNIIISKDDTGNNLSMFAYTGYAKIGPSLHLHLHQDEIFSVTEGSYRFVIGDETMELTAGDTVFLPRNVPHSWIQLTDQGSLLYTVQPAGSMEAFFKEMNDLKKPPTAEESQAIHLKHGMKVVGPPLSL